MEAVRPKLNTAAEDSNRGPLSRESEAMQLRQCATITCSMFQTSPPGDGVSGRDGGNARSRVAKDISKGDGVVPADVVAEAAEYRPDIASATNTSSLPVRSLHTTTSVYVCPSKLYARTSYLRRHTNNNKHHR